MKNKQYIPKYHSYKNAENTSASAILVNYLLLMGCIPGSHDLVILLSLSKSENRIISKYKVHSSSQYFFYSTKFTGQENLVIC